MFDSALSPLPPTAPPQLSELLLHWRALRSDGKLPGRQDFDPVAVPRLLPNLWLLDVRRHPLRFKFRLIGTAVVEFAGRDSTGRWLDEVYPDYESTGAFRCTSACVTTRLPQYRKGTVLSNPERWYATAERLYLPLASDGETVDMLLNFTIYDWVEPDRRGA